MKEEYAFLKREEVQNRQDLIRISRQIQTKMKRIERYNTAVCMVYAYPVWGIAELYLTWLGHKSLRIGRSEIDFLRHESQDILGYIPNSMNFQIFFTFIDLFEDHDPEFYDWFCAGLDYIYPPAA